MERVTDMLKLINKLYHKLRVEIMYEATVEQYLRDCWILYVECPYMELLGCINHFRMKLEEPKNGWYKDGKFVCEEM